VRRRSRLLGSLARAACGWVSEGVTPFLSNHRPSGSYPRTGVMSGLATIHPEKWCRL
jgi:hypothetical protein